MERNPTEGLLMMTVWMGDYGFCIYLKHQKVEKMLLEEECQCEDIPDSDSRALVTNL
jgi:hypothetical protein